jgi:signal transduction histidine kinase
MMRSLYLKILLHWIFALVVTEALIFVLFITVVGDSHRQYLIRSVGQSANVDRDFIQAAVAADVANGATPAAALQRAVRNLSTSAGAKIWVTDPDGKPVSTSFAGEIPPPATKPGDTWRHDGVTISIRVRKGMAWYATVPVALPAYASPLLLHIVPQRTGDGFPHAAFAAGLAVIGILVAILAVPLTRRITTPLKRLQESALCIAGGDLTARADITEKDEIGRLAVTFNSMAETVERMVRGGKELTANVSHELRSPLARIRVAGECLKDAVDKGDKQEAEEMLEAIWEDIDEADAMIGRILQFSKLDLHEPLPLNEEVAPAELISGLVKTLGPLARSKSISIEVNVLEDEKVTGDEDMLRAAFKNLLENAVRHTAEGGKVEVAMRREDAGLVTEITNTHPPVDPEELELIFTPFYRGKHSRTEGTGLGLAIAKKIITLHHGDISAGNVMHGFQVRVDLEAKKLQR